MGWLIALGIVAALAVLPLGASIKYDADGAVVRLIAGPVRLTLFPRPKKEKKTDLKADQKKTAKQSQKKASSGQKSKQVRKKTASEKATMPLTPKEKGGSILDFLPLVKVLLNFLNGFRRKLRINVLNVKLIMAADDPCDLAVNYGRAWAALGNLLPQLEKVFVIKKRNLEVACDFTASQTLIIARADLTITLGRLLALAAVLAFRAVKEYVNIRKKRKGGATNESKSS